MIRVSEQPEPLTVASAGTPSKIAESEAYRSLLRELRRYGRRETSGRSFLIAGHRGAGKTTLVRQAIQTTQRESAELSLWPTLISLHGPDLLGGDAVEQPRGPAGQGKSTDADKPKDNGESNGAAETATAYRLLAKSLHRALMDELAMGFRRHVTNRPDLRADGAELAAAVQHELEHAPDLATLREYWRRAGALESGVLLSHRPLSRAGRSDQGFRELIAAGMAIEAFRVIAGTDKKTQNEEDDRSNESKSTLTKSLAGKDLLPSLIGIATGGIVGTAVNQGPHPQPFWAAVAGLGAAIAAAFTVSSTLTASRAASLKTAQEFTWTRRSRRSSACCRCWSIGCWTWAWRRSSSSTSWTRFPISASAWGSWSRG